jgi:hypothetical protein
MGFEKVILKEGTGELVPKGKKVGVLTRRYYRIVLY